MTKKNYLLLGFLVLTVPFFISSCNDDDDDDNGFSIVGTWNVDKVIETEIENGEVISEDVYYYEGITFTFNRDGTGLVLEEHEDEETFSWAIIGDELVWSYLEGPDAGLTTIYNLNIISPKKIELEYHDTYDNYEIIETTVLSKL